MLGSWRIRSLLREGLVAFFCALTLLAGVTQARAGTEFAAKSGFASALTLCQQNGSGGGSPDPDPNCDHCRMPAPLAIAAPFAMSTCQCQAANRPLVLLSQPRAEATRTILPEARGPPQQG